MEWIGLIIASVFVNNVLLSSLLGLCPVVGTSNTIKLAVGMGLATLVVLTFVVPLSFVMVRYLIVPFDILYLQSIFMIMLIAFAVGFVEIILKNISRVLYDAIGIYFPLITSNCAILGVGMLSIRDYSSLFEASLFGLGSGLGFLVVLLLVAFIKEKTDKQPTPIIFRGYPITFTTLGVMAMAFLGFM